MNESPEILTAYSDSYSMLKRLERLLDICRQLNEVALIRESTRSIEAVCDRLNKYLYPEEQENS